MTNKDPEKSILPQDPPLRYKNPFNTSHLFCIDSCAVSVVYVIYDPKKNVIVESGSSRACGHNHGRNSIHAEEIALHYCRQHDKRNRFRIYIWRYSRGGHIKKKECCDSCTKLLKKYHYEDKIFTFDVDKFVTAISYNPELSVCYKIKYGL